MIRRAIRPAVLALGALLPASAAADGDPAERLGRGVVRLVAWKAALVAEGVGLAVADDLIVTNRHVVYGAVRGEVVLLDRRRLPIGEVVAADRYRDLALLRVQAPAGTLVPLPLSEGDAPDEVASCAPLKLSEDFEGDDETPLPLLHRFGTITRRRPLERGGFLLGADLEFSAGDSGTPLLDAERERVVGVLSMVHVPVAGGARSYAIPASRVRELVAEADPDRPFAASLFEWQRRTVNDPEWMTEAAVAIGEDPRRGRKVLACEMLEGLVREHAEDEPPTLSREAYFEHARCLLREANEIDEDEAAEAAALRAAAEAFRVAERAPALQVFDDLVLSLAIYQRGACLLRLGEAEAAAALLERYVAREPEDVDGYELRAWAALAAGDRDGAERALERLVERVGEGAEGVVELREAVEGTGGG